MKTTLFRITQEALTNVIKHAAASHVKVTLTYDTEGVRLDVVDDGVGFNQSAMQLGRRPSWGLIGMEERSTLLGGTFKVTSYPGAGTRVEIYIPYINKTEGKEDENTPIVSG